MQVTFEFDFYMMGCYTLSFTYLLLNQFRKYREKAQRYHCNPLEPGTPDYYRYYARLYFLVPSVKPYCFSVFKCITEWYAKVLQVYILVLFVMPNNVREWLLYIPMSLLPESIRIRQTGVPCELYHILIMLMFFLNALGVIELHMREGT